MMKRLMKRFQLAILAAIVMTCGCSPTVKDQVLPFTPDPIREAQALLNNYASGQPVGSETSGFDDLVTRVSQVDEAKGDELRTFLDEVMTKGVASRAKAKELLDHW